MVLSALRGESKAVFIRVYQHLSAVNEIDYLPPFQLSLWQNKERRLAEIYLKFSRHLA